MDVARERMGGTPIPGRPAADQAGRADGASASGHGAGADWQMEELAEEEDLKSNGLCKL